MAEQDATNQRAERDRALELERQQAEYEVHLAARRYEAVDPDNRLVAAELEARWNDALAKLRECDAKRVAAKEQKPSNVTRDELQTLAADLGTAWSAPNTDMKTKQRLVRALIEEIVVDVDDATREVVLLIHWRGGQHSELRAHKPRSGEHRNRAPDEADKIIRQMATQWPDDEIAATLNRMGLLTGQKNTWNAVRVGAYRRKHNVPAYESSVKDGRCLTMIEAVKKLGVSHYFIRKLIRTGILPARQVVKDAPWQIQAADLDRPEVQEALRQRRGRGRPSRKSEDQRTLQIPGI